MNVRCHLCDASVKLLHKHPPYHLPHGYGYPALDVHYDPRGAYVRPCDGSGMWVRVR